MVCNLDFSGSLILHDGILYISPAAPDDLDAFEIPQFYWTSIRKCEIARISFLRALQYRLGWAEGNKYYFNEKVIRAGNISILIYVLKEDAKMQ